MGFKWIMLYKLSSYNFDNSLQLNVKLCLYVCMYGCTYVWMYVCMYLLSLLVNLLETGFFNIAPEYVDQSLISEVSWLLGKFSLFSSSITSRIMSTKN